MSTRLIDLLLALTARERWLLTCGALVLVLGLGYGVLLPLQTARHQAEARLENAHALETWIIARAQEKQSLTQGNSVSLAIEPLVPIGTSAVEQGLITARLRPALSALSTQGDGEIDLRFDQVDFIRLATWLSDAHPEWGYQISSIRLEAPQEVLDNPDRATGQVTAWITLSPPEGLPEQ